MNLFLTLSMKVMQSSVHGYVTPAYQSGTRITYALSTKFVNDDKRYKSKNPRNTFLA